MRYTFKFGYTCTFKKKNSTENYGIMGFYEHIIRSNYFPIFKTFSPLLTEHFVHFFFVKLVDLHVWINNM